MMNKNKNKLPILRYAKSDEACVNGGLIPHDAGSGSRSSAKKSQKQFPIPQIFVAGSRRLSRRSLNLRLSLSSSVKSDVTMGSDFFNSDCSSLSSFGLDDDNSGRGDGNTGHRTPFDETTTTATATTTTTTSQFDRWGARTMPKGGQRNSYPPMKEKRGTDMPRKPRRRGSTGSFDGLLPPPSDSSPRIPGRGATTSSNDTSILSEGSYSISPPSQNTIIEEDETDDNESVRGFSAKHPEAIGLQSVTTRIDGLRKKSFAPGSA